MRAIIGYAWIYGISLIVGSYPVLFVSLTAHAAQFAFLVFFENPRMFSPLNATFIFVFIVPCLDIERRYGQPKPIAQRTPLYPSTPCTKSTECSQSSALSTGRNSPFLANDPSTTPTATDGDTATESD